MEETAKVGQARGHGPSLELAQERFARWREARRRGARVPADLWEAAVDLAEAQGVQRVADALHLDVGRLGRRMQRAVHDTQFVELLVPAMTGRATTATDVRQCVVELHNAHGATMRVELAGSAVTALADLCKAFCGA